MKYSILFLFCLYSIQNTFAQSKIYKDSIELQLKLARKGNIIYHDKDSAGYRLYWYSKSQKQIVTIAYKPPNKCCAYEYFFLNGQLVRFRPYLPYSMNPEAKGKPMSAAYYFRNNILIEKIEINFPVIDIEYYIKLGLDLFDRSKLFLRNKRIYF